MAVDNEPVQSPGMKSDVWDYVRRRNELDKEIQEKFAAAYRAAGGDCQLHVFPDSEHEWVAKPGPQTDRAREMLKGFIARNLAA